MISGLFSLPLATTDAPGDRVRAGGTNGCGSFIAGPENALVRTLADAVLAEPLDYNPIVLCGPLGVGKSSLAHSLVARRAGALALQSVLTSTGADLARALAHAVETDSASDFRARHHRCDLLLIDDLHQLADKPAAQQFVLTALDALLRRGSLVIVTLRSTSAASSKDDGLVPALASRLAGGLAVPLVPPGPLARRELVQHFASRINLVLNDDIVNQLATCGENPSARSPTAARLRHIVMQLGSLAEESRGRIKASQVACLLTEESPETKVICRQVMTLVARHFGRTLGDLRGKSRQQTIAEARGLAMYVARQLTGASYAEIGRQFGSRDHTTVLHACRKLADLVAHDEVTRRLTSEFALQVSDETAN